MKKFTLLLFLGLVWSWCGFAQVTIGTQEMTTSTFPIYSCYNYSYSQQLVYQSEINAAGDITSLSFYFNNATSSGTDNSNDWTVYMGHTSKTEFADTDDWVSFSDLTEVFSGTVTYPSEGSQMVITFDTPFTYNNTDNLVFAVDENKDGFDCSIYFGATAYSGPDRTLYYRSDTVNPDPASPPTAYSVTNSINNVILGGIQQACPAPTDLAVTATTTTTADVEWTESGSATEWNVIYGAPGFDPLTEGQTVTDDDGVAGTTLTGLTASTDYEVYVQAACGTSELSSLLGPVAFNTECENEDVPYYLPFETGASCITTENLGSGQGWQIVTGANNGFEGTYARYYFSSDPANAWLYTNGINLETGVNYQISYTYGNNSTFYTEKMDVFMGTDPVAANMTTELADHPEISDATPHTNIVVFTVPANDVYYFGFHAYSGANEYYLHLDDISVIVAPSCPAPTDLSVDAVSADSADLSWTPGNTETEWEVVYGTPGFDPDTEGDVIQVSVDPETTIPNLDADTEYEFYVRGICGVGDESVWVGPIAFTTACLPGEIPFVEGFESGYTDGEALAGCWTQVSETGSYSWITNSSETSYNRTPKTGDFNIYLMYGNTRWVFYALDLTADTEYELKFYARQDASSGATVEAAFGDSATPAAMTTTVVASTDVVNGAYQEFSGFFTPTTTGTYYVGIKGSLNYTPYYLSIDDISVDLAPACLKPVDLAVDAITEATADVSWTEQGSATEWEVVYGSVGFDPTTEGTTVPVSTDPEVTLESLTPSELYDVYVRAVCGAGDESEWTGPLTFRTACAPGTVPFAEGFELGYTDQDPLEGCWSQESLDGGDQWMVNSSLTNYNRTPRTGDFNIYLRYGNEDWIFYPLDLTAGTVYQLKFYAVQDAAEGASVEAAYGTSNNAAAMTNSIIATSDVVSGTYQEFFGFFTPTTSDTYYIGIKGTVGFVPWYLSIDDISVEEATGCITPIDLAATSITQNSAFLTWTQNGSATEWEVVYGTAGFDPITGGTTETVNDDPEITIGGLDANTDYDFYVTAICGAGNESDMAGPKTFTTLCEPTTVPYIQDFETAVVPDIPECTTKENAGNGNEWVTQVYNENGMSGNVLRYGYNSSNPANAWFYTQGLELVAGVDYQLSYKYYGSSSWPEKMKVAYGTVPHFTDMTEQLVDQPNIGSAGEEVVTFTVDVDGTYYFGFNVYSDANQNYLYVDDINIIEVAACEAPTDIAVTDVTENGATVTWTASSTEAEGYTVDVYLEGADPNTATPEVTETVATGITTVDITGLDADTSYDVYVTTLCDNGNTAMSGAVNFVTMELGINGNGLTQISYFPNPVKDELTITAGKTIDNVTVYNLLGQTVLTVQPKGTNAVVDMSALPTGTYVLKANVADAVSTFKVLKQ